MADNRFCEPDVMMALHWVDRLDAALDESNTPEVCEALRYWIERAAKAEANRD